MINIYNVNKHVYVFIKNNKLFDVNRFGYFIYDLSDKNSNKTYKSLLKDLPTISVHQIDYDSSIYLDPSDFYSKIEDNYNLNKFNTGEYKSYFEQIDELDIEIKISIRDGKINRLLDERI
jgi:hypothetical protein